MVSKKLSNKGFGAYELLTMAMVTLILSFIVLQIALNSQKGEKYKVFAYNAKMMGTNAISMQMLEDAEDASTSLYLSKMIEEGIVVDIKNPFDGDRYCNREESKVVFEDDKKFVDLRCGNMVIQNMALGDTKADIYEVSDWKTKRESKKDVERTFYNYQKDNKDVLEKDLEEALFIETVNETLLKKYQSIEEIKKDLKVVEKTYYRSEKKVKTVEY